MFGLYRQLRVFSLSDAISVARTGEMLTGYGLTHRCGVDTDRAGPYENIYVSSRRSRALMATINYIVGTVSIMRGWSMQSL